MADEELDYSVIFEKIVKDSGRHDVSPGKLSKISQEMLILMIDCKSMTRALGQEIGKNTKETSARLFRLQKSGYVSKSKTGWELTVLGEVLAKHLKSMRKTESELDLGLPRYGV
jgi:predicted transcriptional regulator